MWRPLSLCPRALVRHLNSNLPREPTPLPRVGDPNFDPKVSADLVKHLERLSLVDFSNEEGVKRLEESIRFAQPLTQVDTRGIEPMYSVLEDQSLYLRPDTVTEVGTKSDILSNATLVEEDYFVAPPGNIPLSQENKSYHKKE